MYDVTVDTKPLDTLAERLGRLPYEIRWARTSALKSTGYFVRQEVADHIRTGGRGTWPEVHPLTATFRKKRGVKHRWFGRRLEKAPLEWLAQYVRYRTDSAAGLVQVSVGKSRSGKPGVFDPEFIAIVRRVQEGERTAVTEKMRRFFGATRRRRPKRQIPGLTFFPLKKSTRWLWTPPRPIFDPVLARIEHEIPRHFERKFLRALKKHREGVVR